MSRERNTEALAASMGALVCLEAALEKALPTLDKWQGGHGDLYGGSEHTRSKDLGEHGHYVVGHSRGAGWFAGWHPPEKHEKPLGTFHEHKQSFNHPSEAFAACEAHHAHVTAAKPFSRPTVHPDWQKVD